MLALGVLTCLLEKCGGIPPLASVVALLGPCGFLCVLLGSYECLCVPMGGGYSPPASVVASLGSYGFLWFHICSYVGIPSPASVVVPMGSFVFLLVSMGSYIYICIYTYIYIH